MKDSTVLAVFGMGCLTAIEIVCLLKSIDSVALASIVAVISGLAGYEIRKRSEK